MEQTELKIAFNLNEPIATLAQVHGILDALQKSQKWQEAVNNPDSHHEMDSDIANAKHHIREGLNKYSNAIGCYIASAN